MIKFLIWDSDLTEKIAKQKRTLTETLNASFETTNNLKQQTIQYSITLIKTSENIWKNLPVSEIETWKNLLVYVRNWDETCMSYQKIPEIGQKKLCVLTGLKHDTFTFLAVTQPTQLYGLCSFNNLNQTFHCTRQLEN